MSLVDSSRWIFTPLEVIKYLSRDSITLNPVEIGSSAIEIGIDFVFLDGFSGSNGGIFGSVLVV